MIVLVVYLIIAALYVCGIRPEGTDAILAIGPLAAAAANVGARVLGGVLARAIAGRPRRFRLRGAAIQAAQQQLSDLESQERRDLAFLEEQLARSGATGLAGSAARQRLQTAAAQRALGLRSSILDTLASVGQTEQMLNTQLANQERQQLVTSIVGGAELAGSALQGLISPPAVSGATVAAQEAAATPGGGQLLDAPLPQQVEPSFNVLTEPMASVEQVTRFTPNSFPTLPNILSREAISQRMFRFFQPVG